MPKTNVICSMQFEVKLYVQWTHESECSFIFKAHIDGGLPGMPTLAN